MKNISKIFFFILIFGCNQKENYTKIFIEKPNINVNDNNDFISSFSIIQLNTPEENPIGEISKMIIINDKIIIIDEITKALFKHTKDGIYINCIRQIGKSPTEYNKITDLSESENGELQILCDRNKLLSLDSTFSKIKKSENQLAKKRVSDGFYVFNKKHSLFYINNSTGKSSKYSIEIVNWNDKTSENFIEIKDYHRSIIRSMSGNQIVKLDMNTVLFMRSYDNFIYEITPNYEKKRYCLEFGNLTIDEEYLKNNKYPYKDKDHINVASFFGNKDYLIFECIFNKEIFYAFYSIKSEKVKYYHLSSLSVNKPIGKILYFDGNYIYSTLSPAIVLSLVEQLKANNYEKHYANFIEQTKKINNSGNPLIFISKIQPF